MNMTVRIIVGVVGIIIIAAGLFGAALYLNFFDVSGTALQSLAGQDEAALAALVLLLLGLILVGVSLHNMNVESGRKIHSITIYNQNGEVNIAFQAVENMALRVAREINGIRETTTKVQLTEMGLTIELRVKVLPDLQIPNLSSELQDKVREYVEDKTGTSVNEVRVTVENIVVDNMVSKRRN